MKSATLKLISISTAMLLGVAPVLPAAASDFTADATQSVVAQAAAMPLKGRVTSVDVTSRTMTVLGEHGKEVRLPLVMRPDDKTLPQVGDAIALQYKDALVVELHKVAAQSDGIRKRVDTDVFLPTASGYEVARQVEVEATVLHVDTQARKVTLRGATRRFAMDVHPGVDLKQVHPGDTVRLVFVQTYAVQDTQG
ncbi:MAG: hypothetical protein V4793_10515 [Paraburkholderia tropica]|uniref:Copper-binding protein n=1 Tax=Paraburkholderia tropica TaxID=92647 RepID=A0ABX5ML52_9BURK|nr:hypothetical protein [Paraburkholderia tropica]MBB3002123.1 hypothetical protein [Paraburkholderia tropica]MBB6321506.1 hypothetical protein [Paraburkholderia tropica]MDE1138623.1 hypothetical protein [Paraburkholderia tropica]PXX14131.1 hypothetical protein C7400_11365 [Paraburkholderia tropica]PZW78967.1 hypothetical protein C7399_11365 [Paraburkholderia tropica]